MPVTGSTQWNLIQTWQSFAPAFAEVQIWNHSSSSTADHVGAWSWSFLLGSGNALWCPLNPLHHRCFCLYTPATTILSRQYHQQNTAHPSANSSGRNHLLTKPLRIVFETERRGRKTIAKNNGDSSWQYSWFGVGNASTNPRPCSELGYWHCFMVRNELNVNKL